MPTLTRFLRNLAICGGLVFAAMLALANLVEPEVHRIVVPLDDDVLRNAVTEAAGDSSSTTGAPMALTTPSSPDR